MNQLGVWFSVFGIFPDLKPELARHSQIWLGRDSARDGVSGSSARGDEGGWSEGGPGLQGCVAGLEREGEPGLAAAGPRGGVG